MHMYGGEMYNSYSGFPINSYEIDQSKKLNLFSIYPSRLDNAYQSIWKVEIHSEDWEYLVSLGFQIQKILNISDISRDRSIFTCKYEDLDTSNEDPLSWGLYEYVTQLTNNHSYFEVNNDSISMYISYEHKDGIFTMSLINKDHQSNPELPVDIENLKYFLGVNSLQSNN